MEIFEILAVVFFIFGICVGSFCNVLIYRLPRGESVNFPASHCQSCNALFYQLAFSFDNRFALQSRPRRASLRGDFIRASLCGGYGFLERRVGRAAKRGLFRAWILAATRGREPSDEARGDG